MYVSILHHFLKGFAISPLALDPFSGLGSFQVRSEIKYRKEKLGIEYYYS